MNALADTPVPGAATRCTHCGLPVPAGLLRDGSAEQFCCHGCETAYSVIHSCGLDAYYALRDQTDVSPTAPKPTRRAYAEFDDPAFRALYARPDPAGLRIELLLQGIHCAACVWLVEKLPGIVPGVARARLDFRRSTLEVTFDPSRTTLSTIAQTLDRLGYPAQPSRSPAAREARRVEDRRMLVRLAVAGACAGNIMLIFFALYAGMLSGDGDMDRGHEQLFRWVAMVLNTVCLLWPGAVFGRSALASLRARSIHLDVPIALGLYLGGVWGIWKTVAGGAGAGDIYFDSISALIFFLLIGRYVQQRQQRFAADAVELLFSVTPAVARRVEPDGSIAEVASQALRPGDIVEVRAGDCFPADGTVCPGQGSSHADLSLLTGESRPVLIAAGDHAAAGSVNLSAALRVRVEATGEETRIGKLMRMVDEASQRRAAIVRLADAWGRWLLWALLALAALTLALWWHAGPAIAIDHAVALLIATCPCGLGLATPLAMTIAIGRAARRGFLVKGGDALQSLSAPGPAGVIVLDKTGTLTLGKLSVVRWKGDARTAALAAILESQSSHPAARALDQGITTTLNLSSPRDVVQHAGAGIEGVIEDERLVIGTRALMSTLGIAVDAEFEHFAASALADGLSPTFIAVGGRCAAAAALGDAIRPDAAASIARLRARGWQVMILSGDHPAVVAAVGRQLGVDLADCRAHATPEDKLAIVRELARDRRVVMVGDGINDAAALAAATVGIAVRGGAEASLAAADVSLSQEGLTPIVELMDGARRTMRTIHLTIASSLFYNVIAAGLSVAGLISPLLAAFIMPTSSLTVVAICLRSGAFRRLAPPVSATAAVPERAPAPRPRRLEAA